MRPAEEAELGTSSTAIGLVVADGCHDCGSRPAGVGAGDAGRRRHAARRHAVDPRRDDAVSRPTPIRPNPKITDADGNVVNRNAFDVAPRLHQHHRQHLAPRRVPHHAGHHPGERAARARTRQQRVERQPGVSDQVRLRPVQPRRLDDAGARGRGSASSRRRGSTSRRASTATGSRARCSPSASRCRRP